MSSSHELERYLNLFRLRLKQLVMARALAVLATSALLITVIAVSLAIRRGFPGELVIASRVLLFAALGAIIYRWLVIPARRLDADGSETIELRAPAFAGRVRTWAGIRSNDNPLAELLAEDSLKIAGDNSPEQRVPQKEFSLSLGVAGLAAAALLALGIAGPGNYAYGVRHLWFGWALPGLLPPQSIEVLPGDGGIRLGGNIEVTATMRGFAPSRAFVHARFGDGEWQQVEMAEADQDFGFTFFSVREPLEYYVSAANIRSETFSVDVVDLPVIENLTVTYRYPVWTGRGEQTVDPGGDVRAIEDTGIVIRVRADRDMTPGDLIVDGRQIPLAVDGREASAEFEVQQDGQYFVAASVGGEQIRLTDDYFITKLDDELPKIEFARPGRDWKASSIEEVTTRVIASDDFRVEDLELRYSINGGAWQTIELPSGEDNAEAEHVFFLESLADDAPLVPGDLVSYYAVAGDRQNSARTDIFFIDVQPFDRRYTQSQQSGGAMGQPGQRQDEISARQKEIIVSTWNLIREQQEGRRDDPAYVTDNAALLSRVQATLREQVETLAARTEARQLTASADEIARFVEHLQRASEAMVPAAERLASLDLEPAILPEQEALQHLLAAEAVFTDISVSLQANNRGGGGGQAGRDLTEMFELEMDLEKNQYETGNRATPEAPQQQMEEAADELEELARRQERLARNLDRNRQPTPAQRWQQEMLRRDVEELRQRLERMQQQSAAQRGSEGEAGADGVADGQPGSRQADELRRRLESAVRAMNDADEAMRAGGRQDELQRASEEARRQLEGARDQADAARRQAMQASLDELADKAGEAFETQQSMENRLQEAIRGISVGQNDLDRLDSGMSILEEYELAADKRRLQTDVQELEQDARNTAQQIGDGQPGAADQIREALDKLRDAEVETRLAIAAAYIQQGEAVYVAGSESAVTEALRELRDDLQRARSALTNTGPDEPGETARDDGLADTLAETRALRRELQRLAAGEDRRAVPVARGRDDLQEPSGLRVGDLDVSRDFDRAADNISQNVLSLFRGLNARGVPVQDIDELRRLAAAIRASEWSGNPELLEAEARRALSLVEQLEVALARSSQSKAAVVRTNPADEIPEDQREIVADYYRRLGQADESTDP